MAHDATPVISGQASRMMARSCKGREHCEANRHRETSLKGRQEPHQYLKAFTSKSSITVGVLAPNGLGLQFLLGAAAAGENGILLLALTLCGAVVSGLNGFGRRTVRGKAHSRGGRRGPQSSVALTS